MSIVWTQKDWNEYIVRQIGKEFVEQLVSQYVTSKEHMEDILLLYWDQIEKYQKTWPQLANYDIHQLADIMTKGFNKGE